MADEHPYVLVEDGAPGSVEEMRHLPFIATTADEQVGRIIRALDSQEVLDETLGLRALARSGRAHENDAHARFLT